MRRLAIGADRLQREQQRLARVDLHRDLLLRLSAIEKHRCRQCGRVTELTLMLAELAHLARIHQPGGELGLAQDLLAVLFSPGPHGNHVHRGQPVAGAVWVWRYFRRIQLEHLARQGLRKAIGWESQLALEQRNHRLRESHLVRRVAHIGGREVASDHHQCHVANHLRGGCDLDNVAEELIDVGIGLRNFGPAMRQAECAGLLTQVGVLTAGHLVAVDIGRPRTDLAFEGGIEAPHALEVCRGCMQGLRAQARIPRGAA
ncbi:hypothetical protein Y695_03978 [Hydrogenophaga sp. T4]|nr:hypothetical protein Y695_03978 [Hydrogenophaga sp. T4]